MTDEEVILERTDSSSDTVALELQGTDGSTEMTMQFDGTVIKHVTDISDFGDGTWGYGVWGNIEPAT